VVQSAPIKNRWLIAFAGVIVMISLGTVYSWSIFTRPLIASFHWTNTVTTWAFAFAIFFLGIGAVIGGRWQDRVGPRTVTLAGVALWGIGNILAGIGTSSLGQWWLYLTYGAIGGLGLGMGYITPVATVTKWFPDKRGLASGMVVMGFGLGAFIYNQIVPRIASFADAAKHSTAYIAAKDAAAKAGTAFDPSTLPPGAQVTSQDVAAVMAVFWVSGIVFLIIGGFCATFLSNPPAGYTVAGAVAAAATSGRKRSGRHPRCRSRRRASTSLPDLPITMPGRAVWMFTSSSPESLRIVMSERPACASFFVMYSRMRTSSARYSAKLRALNQLDFHWWM